MDGLLQSFLTIMIIVWTISILLIGLVFSMAANERRREIAVLRAIGASQQFVFGSIVMEAALLALIAGAAGLVFAGFSTYIFRDLIAASIGPFLFPGPVSLLILFITGLALSLVTVSLSSVIPALRISRQEAAIAMRE
jgi:putative ABC transport system permease protein